MKRIRFSEESPLDESQRQVRSSQQAATLMQDHSDRNNPAVETSNFYRFFIPGCTLWKLLGYFLCYRTLSYLGKSPGLR
jgi:hypothetical protein